MGTTSFDVASGTHSYSQTLTLSTVDPILLLVRQAHGLQIAQTEAG